MNEVEKSAPEGMFRVLVITPMNTEYVLRDYGLKKLAFWLSDRMNMGSNPNSYYVYNDQGAKLRGPEQARAKLSQ